ncbi:MAG: DEAD/DEAH box helicase, partial [Bacteroidaceae bacterium]|nr:DEAD/DEAH box helicase [Bacteroidaceae bacterium]
QYTPGNSIVVDGVVYQVSGVQFANMFQGAHAFQPIARNANKTVYEDVNSISDKIPWDVNNQECVELVRPVGFLPDVKDSKSRIADNKVYTHVNAQLIDGDEWTDTAKDQYLFKLRSNKQIGTAKILYYNEGKGYGYCLCTVCGRAAIEDAVAENTFDKMPKDYNPISPKERFDQNGNPKPKFHWALTGKNAGNPCLGSNNKEYIKRNMIIGDLLQTDFCEIKIRKPNENWITNRSMDMELLYTLGIVLTQSLAEYLGKERNAVDFTIMPNGHLCIFDTNPGGAGYSNQLTQLDGDDKPVTMIRVLEVAKKMLLQAKAKKSKDMLLDKFTLRYLKYIDIDKALQWISDNNLD